MAGFILPDVPVEVMSYVFSFLELPDLARTARVCRGWKQAQEVDWLWKGRCLDVLDRGTTRCGSWKEQYKIFSHVKRGITRATDFKLPIKRWGVRPLFTLLDDNSVLELVTEPKNASLVHVHDIGTDSILRTIDISRCGEVFSSNIHGEEWTILTHGGRIVSFNIVTGQCVREIQGDPPKEVRLEALPKIYCTDREIIVWGGQKITIWDARSGARVQTLDVPETEGVWSMCSTPQFLALIVREYDTGRTVVKALKKADQTIREIEVHPSCFCLESSGPYIAFLTSSGDTKVFVEDLTGELREAHSLSCTDGAMTVLSLYRNWLCVGGPAACSIYDLRTWKKIARLPGVLCCEIRTNAEVVFERTVGMALGPCAHDSYIRFG